jgi:hypothetical protein
VVSFAKFNLYIYALGEVLVKTGVGCNLNQCVSQPGVQGMFCTQLKKNTILINANMENIEKHRIAHSVLDKCTH